MKRLGGGLLITAVALTAVLLAQACSDADTTAVDRPSPEINAAMAPGVLKCAQWSMSFDVCYMRPGDKERVGYDDPYAWDGCACCLEYTFDASKVDTKPKCSIPDPGYEDCGEYWLDPGSWSGWEDDFWYCDGSFSCCADAHDPPHYFHGPTSGDVNTNCEKGKTTCNRPDPPLPDDGRPEPKWPKFPKP